MERAGSELESRDETSASVLVGPVPRPVTNIATLELRLDVLWYATLHTHGVHPAHIFCWREQVSPEPEQRDEQAYMFSATAPPSCLQG